MLAYCWKIKIIMISGIDQFPFNFVGFPSPPMNLKKISVETLYRHHGQQILLLQWNASEATDNYIITSSPSVAGSRSNIITPNTTIEIPVLHNQEYNISVIASNCAGNSTPAEITVFIVPCKCILVMHAGTLTRVYM